MIVTLTGAYKNVGDHLIGDAARTLLKEFVDEEVINVDRGNITEETYDLFNQARAVVLCGGPAYQKNIYPDIYNLDLNKIKTKIVPLGLGYKDSLNSSKFSFSKTGKKFVEEVHKRINYSSARDIKTLEALQDNGIQNVAMTGCPAWYDITKMNQNIESVKNVNKLGVSVPAKFDLSFLKFLRFIKNRFKGSKKILIFHHGVFVGTSVQELKMTIYNLMSAVSGLFCGYRIISLKADLDKMKTIYNDLDLHIGHRVHAHLFRLSQRKPSILVSEDQRGVSQTMTLGMKPILTSDPNFLEILNFEINDVMGMASHNQKAIEVMREKFEVMKKFLIDNLVS